MKIARVLGHLTLTKKDPGYKPGAYLICEAMDDPAVKNYGTYQPRKKKMSESFVVFDTMGAGQGDVIAVAEGPEAALPYRPDIVPVNASCAAILDWIELN